MDSQLQQEREVNGGTPFAEARGSAADVIRLYVVEYEYRNQQWRTVVEARDIEAAKRQFRRDNPDVEMVACY
jgi:hypothetical protein